MTNSERMAQALAEMFRCSQCDKWKPLRDIGRDIPWDAELVAGYLCWLCERDLWLLAELSLLEDEELSDLVLRRVLLHIAEELS